MPNFCDNSLKISGSKDKVLELLYKVQNTKEFFNVIRPRPTELMNIHSGGQTINGVYVNEWRYDENNIAIAVKDEELVQLKAKYGTTNLIDWSYNNWGTKWDTNINEDEINEAIKNIQQEPDNVDVVFSLEYFSTAWNAPLEIYNYLHEQGFEVDAYFYEGGNRFYGWYYDGSQYTGEYNCFDDIPDEIVEIFGIEKYYVDGDDEDEE